VGVGDDAEGVVLLAAGDADVGVAARGGGGDEPGAADGGRPVAMLRRCVAEQDVVAGSLGWEDLGWRLTTAVDARYPLLECKRRVVEVACKAIP
jgi:hypothetical protein